MAESFSKKEKIKKKIAKQKEKTARREDRKENNDKGKDLEDMMMYVDQYGQLTSTPPDKNDRIDVDVNNIQLGAAPIEADEAVKIGIVTFLSEKGYGFITADSMRENVFFHTNNCSEMVKKGHKVTFEIEKSPKGLVAVEIKVLR